MIESAGETGQNRFIDIRKPGTVQAIIYREMEAYEERRVDRMAGNRGGGSSVASGAREAAPAPSGRGHQPGRVRRAEGPAPRPVERKPRTVSLVPSVTETLLAWDVDVIACTRFCEQPDIRHVGGTKDPDIDTIADLKPDVVVVDTEENRLEDHDALMVAAGLDVHVDVGPFSVHDVPAMLDGLADMVGRCPSELRSNSSPTPPSRPSTAFIPVWRRPWMTVNGSTYTSTVLAAAGVGNVFADHPDRYPTVTEDEIEAAAPALVSRRASPTRSPSATARNWNDSARTSASSTDRTSPGGESEPRRRSGAFARRYTDRSREAASSGVTGLKATPLPISAPPRSTSAG